MRVHYFKWRSVLQSLCDSTNLEIHYSSEEGGVSVSIMGRNSPYVSRHRVEIHDETRLRRWKEHAGVYLTNGNYTLLLSEKEEEELENAVCIPVPSHVILQKREGLFPFPAWVPQFLKERKVVFASFLDTFRGYDEEGAPLFKERYISRAGGIVLEDTRPSCQAGCAMLFLEDECCTVRVNGELTHIALGEKRRIEKFEREAVVERYIPKINEFLGKYGYTVKTEEGKVWYERV